MIMIVIMIMIMIMIHRCPDRYLFDPVTRLCQRESRVSCDQATPSLFYSGLELLVVRLSENQLESFFSQELTLPRRSQDAPVQRPHYTQPGATLHQDFPHQGVPLYQSQGTSLHQDFPRQGVPLYPLPLALGPLHFMSPHFQYYPHHGR